MLFESSCQEFGMRQALDEFNKVQSEICDTQFTDVWISYKRQLHRIKKTAN